MSLRTLAIPALLGLIALTGCQQTATYEVPVSRARLYTVLIPVKRDTSIMRKDSPYRCDPADLFLASDRDPISDLFLEFDYPDLPEHTVVRYARLELMPRGPVDHFETAYHLYVTGIFGAEWENVADYTIPVRENLDTLDGPFRMTVRDGDRCPSADLSTIIMKNIKDSAETITLIVGGEYSLGSELYACFNSAETAPNAPLEERIAARLLLTVALPDVDMPELEGVLTSKGSEFPASWNVAPEWALPE